MQTIDELLEEMWRDYLRLNPGAREVHRLLTDRGEIIVNDHIALRTFQGEPAGLERLVELFKDFDYVPAGDYDFPAKELKAVHLEGPKPEAPRVFISELLTDRFSSFLRDVVADCLSNLSADMVRRPGFLLSGAPWSRSHEVFEKLAGESEYAAWVYAHGFRPNHFTVSVNHLKTFAGLDELNAFLKEQGIVLNTAGGEIKSAEYLDQSSTRAGEVLVNFREGDFPVPGCYYEFALRRKLPDGKLFGGFVAGSADKIFESTNRAETDNRNFPDPAGS